MNNYINKQNQKENPKNQQDFQFDTSKIISDITHSDIEKTYNIDTANGTEAYYSNRYGWTLRRIID